MKTLSAIVVALALLGASGSARDEDVRIGENLRHERVLLPYGSPDKAALALYRVIVVEDEEDVGVLMLYDDRRTGLSVDYIELYDLEGDLLAISWIDRFGVCRIAIERGLLDEHNPRVEGVLVTWTGGDEI